ncbi:MAG: PIN domain-containing protein [Nitrospirae bacterium]|nr:PIN domain-containing protein [Nitrospirota bacterium]
MNGSEKLETELSEFERTTLEMLHIVKDQPVYMSEISLGELYYGAACSQRKEHNFSKISLFQRTISAIPLNSDILMLFGTTKAYLRRQGKSIGDFDLLIACTAKSYNLILVTNDADFKALPETFQSGNWAGKET